VGESALRNSARKLRSGLLYEGLGLLKLTVNERTDALSFFKEARALYKDPEDICRVAIHEIFVLRALGRDTEAVAFARKMMSAHPRAAATEVLARFTDVPAAPQVKPPAPAVR
jgi:hypothetical protein